MRPGPATSTLRCCPSASGCWVPSTRVPWPPAPAWPAGPGRWGMRPGPATSTPRCCPSWSGPWALSTRTPSPPGATSPTGPERLTAAGTSAVSGWVCPGEARKGEVLDDALGDLAGRQKCVVDAQVVGALVELPAGIELVLCVGIEQVAPDRIEVSP